MDERFFKIAEELAEEEGRMSRDFFKTCFGERLYGEQWFRNHPFWKKVRILELVFNEHLDINHRGEEMVEEMFDKLGDHMFYLFM